MAKTLTSDSRRYRFKYTIKSAIDLGLRLFDIGGLDSEEVAIQKSYKAVAGLN